MFSGSPNTYHGRRQAADRYLKNLHSVRDNPPSIAGSFVPTCRTGWLYSGQMKVVFDTSVLRQKYPRQELVLRYLRAFTDRPGAGIIIPDVVVREMRRWIEDEVRKAFKQVRQSTGTLRRFGVSDVFNLADDNAEDTAVKRGLADHDLFLNELGAFVTPIPHGITHERVIDRLHSGRKPFTGTDDREKGYRDYLIWETVLSLGGSEDEGDENGRLPVAFLTANTRDFANEAGRLHPDLLTEAEAAGLLVTLYKSMDEFIATVVEPTLPTSLKVASLLEEDAASVMIAKWISDEFSNFTPYSIDWIGHVYDADIEGATIENLDVVAVEDIADVIDLPGGTAAAQVTVQAQSWVDFFVYKHDAYKWWDNDKSDSLSNWNEWYFLGQTEIMVEGGFHVELELIDGSLRPVSMDVVEIIPLEAPAERKLVRGS